MRIGGRLEPGAARVGQDCVDHTTVAGAGSAIDEAGALEAVQQAGDAGGGEQEPSGEVDAAEALILRARQQKESLVVVDRQPVLGDQLGAELAHGRGVSTQERRPGPGRMYLCGQRLTRQVLSATLLVYSTIADSRRSSNEHYDRDSPGPSDRHLAARPGPFFDRVRGRIHG